MSVKKINSTFINVRKIIYDCDKFKRKMGEGGGENSKFSMKGNLKR